MAKISQAPQPLQHLLSALDKPFNGTGTFNIFVDATPAELLAQLHSLPQEEQQALANDGAVVKQLNKFGITLMSNSDSKIGNTFALDKVLEQRAFVELLGIRRPWPQPVYDRFVDSFTARARTTADVRSRVSMETMEAAARELSYVDTTTRDGALLQSSAHTIDTAARQTHDELAYSGARCFLVQGESILCRTAQEQSIARLTQQLTDYWGEHPPLAIRIRSSSEDNAFARRIPRMSWRMDMEFIDKKKMDNIDAAALRATIAHELGHFIYLEQEARTLTLVDRNSLRTSLLSNEERLKKERPALQRKARILRDILRKMHMLEYAADRLGVIILYLAGHNPEDYAASFASDTVQHKISKTHPSHEDRIAFAKEYTARLLGQ